VRGASRWESGVSAYHGQASPCMCHPSGRAEGQSPFAEGLGVPPNFVISPKSGGSRGLKKASNTAIMNRR
jgi:hypothetical protein